MLYPHTKWNDCQRCTLAETRCKVVHYRGCLPCDVLYIGEAPGRIENVTGSPFMGPAGDCLNLIIQHVRQQTQVYHAITNMIACAPFDDDMNFRAPEPQEVLACAPRLLDLIKSADPKLIVLLGIVSRIWYVYLDRGIYSNELKKRDIPERSNPWTLQIPTVEVVHPSYILRSPREQFGPQVLGAVADIVSAWNAVYHGRRVARRKP